MALVVKIERVRREKYRVHPPTTCEGSIFELDGNRILQLDTFGSAKRALHGKVSQSIQFDEKAAAQLRALLNEAFPTTK